MNLPQPAQRELTARFAARAVRTRLARARAFLFTFLIFNFSLSAGMASQIRTAWTNWSTGLPLTNSFKLFHVGDIRADGGATPQGLPILVTPRPDGYATNSLPNGNYLATNANSASAIYFRAPEDSGPTVYNFTQPGVLISGGNYFVTMIVSNGGGASITFNNVTNALGFEPVSPTKLNATNTAILATATNLSTAERTALNATNTAILATATNLSTAERSALNATNTANLVITTNLVTAERAALNATNDALLVTIIATNKANLIITTNLVTAERTALNATNAALLATIISTNTANLVITTNLVTAVVTNTLSNTNGTIALEEVNNNMAVHLQANGLNGNDPSTINIFRAGDVDIYNGTTGAQIALDQTGRVRIQAAPTANPVDFTPTNGVDFGGENISGIGQISSDNGLFVSDGSGNVTAESFSGDISAGTNLPYTGLSMPARTSVTNASSAAITAERAALNATNDALLVTIIATNKANLIITTNLITAERAALNATNTAILNTATNLAAAAAAAPSALATNGATVTASNVLGNIIVNPSKSANGTTNYDVSITTTPVFTAGTVSGSWQVGTLSGDISAGTNLPYTGLSMPARTSVTNASSAAITAERAALNATNTAILNTATNLAAAAAAAPSALATNGATVTASNVLGNIIVAPSKSANGTTNYDVSITTTPVFTAGTVSGSWQVGSLAGDIAAGTNLPYTGLSLAARGSITNASSAAITAERAALNATNDALLVTIIATNKANLVITTNLVTAERAAMISTNTDNLVVTTNLVAAERAALNATNTAILAAASANLIATNNALLVTTTNIFNSLIPAQTLTPANVLTNTTVGTNPVAVMWSALIKKSGTGKPIFDGLYYQISANLWTNLFLNGAFMRSNSTSWTLYTNDTSSAQYTTTNGSSAQTDTWNVNNGTGPGGISAYGNLEDLDSSGRAFTNLPAWSIGVRGGTEGQTLKQIGGTVVWTNAGGLVAADTNAFVLTNDLRSLNLSGAVTMTNINDQISPSAIISNGLMIINGTLATNSGVNGTGAFLTETGTNRQYSFNGSGLTNLNASSIPSGTLADARLSANVALLSNLPTNGFTFNGRNMTNWNVGGTGIYAYTNFVGTTNGAVPVYAVLTNGTLEVLQNTTFDGSTTNVGVANFLNFVDAPAGDMIVRRSGSATLRIGSGQLAVAGTLALGHGAGSASSPTTFLNEISTGRAGLGTSQSLTDGTLILFGVGTGGTNQVVLSTSTTISNSQTVNMTVYLTAATSLCLTNGAQLPVFVNQTIAAFTPFVLQPHAHLDGTSITCVGTNAW